MESRLDTTIRDCSETKVAQEGTKRKKKTQTWIEPLPHGRRRRRSKVAIKSERESKSGSTNDCSCGFEP